MLHVIATPIGNLGDRSPRALEAFRSSAVIACEDTRRTWQLLTHFGIPRPSEMFSYRQGNEDRIAEKVLADLAPGRDVALCLTKVHERVSRGYLSDLVREYRGLKVKGEVALVVAGCNPKFRRADSAIICGQKEEREKDV